MLFRNLQKVSGNFDLISLIVGFGFLIVLDANAQQNLPPPWNNGDIGKVKVTGRATYAAGTFIVEGSGRDIWDYDDEFHYAYQKRKGNFEIVSRLTGQSKLNGWAKSGLMVRETLDRRSRHGMLVRLPDNKISFVKRESAGGITTLRAPLMKREAGWLKLKRIDNMLIAYESDNGVDWSLFYYTDMPLKEQVYVGLAVSSHSRDELSKTVFSNVLVSDVDDKEKEIPEPLDVSANNVTTNSVELAWRFPTDPDVVGYNVYTSSKKLNSYLVFSNCHSISGLRKNTKYTFTVEAVDFMGRTSKRSAPISVTTRRSLSKDNYVVPVNNPFLSDYNVPKHWTNEIKWSTITDASKVPGLIDGKSAVDSVKLNNVMSTMSKEGGGVLFFPPGTYYFNYHAKVYGGVVIRGADPSEEKSPCNCEYFPTKFEFPKYTPTFTGAGTDNSTSFKKIISDTTAATNFGLVNLDINRATIEFLAGGYKRRLVNATRVIQPSYVHRNVIIYGVRQNNAITPSATVPTKIMTDESKGWQRWPSEFGANVTVWISENCLIARCKFNDQITDDFGQQGYLTDDFFMMDSAKSIFRYIPRDVIAINSNLHKVYYQRGLQRRHDFFEIWRPSWDYQFVPSKNVKVLDNYIIGFEHEGFEPIKSDAFTKGNSVKIHKVNEVITEDGTKAVANDWQKIALTDTIFEKRVFRSRNKKEVPYRLMRPKAPPGNEKYPLVLYLHGIWEAGNDNVNHLRHSVTLFGRSDIRSKYPAYVLCPQHPKEESFSSGNVNSPSFYMEATIELLEQLMKTEPIDPARIYIFGISSGASATIEALMQYPNRFAGALVLSSLYDGFADRKKIEIIKDQPIWFFFGENDQNCPPPYINLAMARLRKVNKSARLTTYPNYGHGIFVKIFEDPEVLNWLFSQKNRI